MPNKPNPVAVVGARFYFIYVITNIVNGKIYVGQHTGNEHTLRQYFTSKLSQAVKGSKDCPRLFRAIRAFGKDNFTIRIIVRSIDHKQQESLESFFIKTLESQNPDIGYNVSPGAFVNHGVTKLIDLAGQTFNRWSVISYVGASQWLCKCSCGTARSVSSTYLRNNWSKSCGCLRNELTSIRNKQNRKQQGLGSTKLYFVWSAIIQRCEDRRSKGYEKYGGKGILVCIEWKHNFRVFYDWATSHGYQEGLILARMNREKEFSPQNCFWSTRVDERKRDPKPNRDWITLELRERRSKSLKKFWGSMTSDERITYHHQTHQNSNLGGELCVK